MRKPLRYLAMAASLAGLVCIIVDVALFLHLRELLEGAQSLGVNVEAGPGAFNAL